MPRDLIPLEPISAELPGGSTYDSADPATDIRLMLAGTEWNKAEPGKPMRTVSGEWMIPIILDLPYAMIASLEAEAQSDEIGHLIRAALVAAGHGVADHIVGVQWSRHATRAEVKAAARPV